MENLPLNKINKFSLHIPLDNLEAKRLIEVCLTVSPSPRLGKF